METQVTVCKAAMNRLMGEIHTHLFLSAGQQKPCIIIMQILIQPLCLRHGQQWQLSQHSKFNVISQRHLKASWLQLSSQKAPNGLNYAFIGMYFPSSPFFPPEFIFFQSSRHESLHLKLLEGLNQFKKAVQPRSRMEKYFKPKIKIRGSKF